MSKEAKCSISLTPSYFCNVAPSILVSIISIAMKLSSLPKFLSKNVYNIDTRLAESAADVPVPETEAELYKVVTLQIYGYI